LSIIANTTASGQQELPTKWVTESLYSATIYWTFSEVSFQ